MEDSNSKVESDLSSEEQGRESDGFLPACFERVDGVAVSLSEVVEAEQPSIVGVEETTQASSNQGSRVEKAARALVVAVGLCIGITGGLGVCLVADLMRSSMSDVGHSYLVLQLKDELDQLKRANQQLSQELVGAKDRVLGTEGNSGKDTEATRAIAAGLDELRSVVESATGLPVFKEANKPSVVIAENKAEKSSEKGALAAILNDPQLNSRGRSGRFRSISRGVVPRGMGGAEVDCSKSSEGKIVCRSSSVPGKKNVTLTGEQDAPVEPAVMAGDADLVVADGAEVGGQSEERRLLQRVKHYTETLKRLPLGIPVQGGFSSGFGYRHSPFSHHGSFHQGIDLSVHSGSKVFATGDGVVVDVDYDGTYGWRVDIAHTPEIVTRYAHLSKVNVRRGDRVTRGGVIALSGSTGRSTGPHLHYEVRYRGRARNPAPYLTLSRKIPRVLTTLS